MRFLAALIAVSVFGQGPDFNVVRNAPSVSVTGSPYFAKCDGTSVDTAAFVSAASSGRTVTLQNATCVVDSAELPSGTTLVCPGGGCTLKPGSSGTVFTVTGTPSAHKSNITLSGITFVGASLDATHAALIANYADNVTSRGNTFNQIQGIYFAPSFTYSSVISTWISTGFRSINDTCYATVTTNGNCISLRYVSGASVSGLTSNGMQWPVYWWGGDANANGAIANTRWAFDIAITNTNVRNAAACVWGSMGSNISVTNSTCDTITDVALDAEGSNNISFVGGAVSNAVNGGMTTFYLNSGVLFSGIAVTQPVAAQPIAISYDVSVSASNQNITYDNIQATCGDAGGNCFISNEGGPATNLTLQNSRLSDVYVDFGAIVNQASPSILNNRLTFSHAITGAAALRVQTFGNGVASVATVQGNTIYSTVAQSSVPCVFLYDADFNFSNTYNAQNNVCTGFSTNTLVETNGANIGQNATFNLGFNSGNITGNGGLTHTDLNSETSTVNQNFTAPLNARGSQISTPPLCTGISPPTPSCVFGLVNNGSMNAVGGIAFNAERSGTATGSGTWYIGGDGSHNAAPLIEWCNIQQQCFVATFASTGGTIVTKTDAQVVAASTQEHTGSTCSAWVQGRCTAP